MSGRSLDTAYLYAPAAQVNEATAHYIATIAQAMQWNDRRLVHVENVAALPDNAATLVVECKSAVKLRLAKPGARYWIWLQGVTPEEARLHMGSRIRETIWNFFERLSLFSAEGLIMVSESMREHYQQKLPKLQTPVFVMPCVNAQLDPELIQSFPSRYNFPSFVYAGGMHAWQCIDLTLATFARLKAKLPAATLTILTKDRARAEAAVRAANLGGVTIDFVPLDMLPNALARHKYGFVLRDDHVVNRVATPTKVSSYMAAGVIPVMTDAVRDYALRLRDVDPIIIARNHSPDAIASEILAVERRRITASYIIESYGQIFTDYFDHDKYIDKLAHFLQLPD